jgi:hypothetical protein
VVGNSPERRFREAGDVKGNTARTVPLHEHLIEQGFVSFAQSKGKGPLFYDPGARRKVDDDPTNPTRRPWAKSRDKLSEWVRSLGSLTQASALTTLGGTPSSA